MNFGDGRGWVPTVGVGLDRQSAESKLKNWRTRNPDDLFRLCKYFATEPKGDKE